MRKLIKVIISNIKSIFNLMWFILFSYKNKLTHFNEIDPLWLELCDYLNLYKEIEYSYDGFDIVSGEGFKWVGGVKASNYIVGIANGNNDCLVIESEKGLISTQGKLSQGEFKWSGGCYWNDVVYGFPRTSNNLLVYDIFGNEVPHEKELKINYRSEHHYGGVCTQKGIVYQPPRNTNEVLKIDLKTFEIVKIVISNIKKKFRYCGSIIHPNGLIYMFPERMGRVMVINPDNDSVYFIGKILSSMVFGASVATDGNIYGFSAYSRGILKIEVKTNTTKMICTDKMYGCYGSMLGLNGNIIGIPGSGNAIYEFCVEKQEVRLISSLDEKVNAKCAGASTSKDATIYCIPALGNKIYKLSPNIDITIPDKFLESYYINGNY